MISKLNMLLIWLSITIGIFGWGYYSYLQRQNLELQLEASKKELKQSKQIAIDAKKETEINAEIVYRYIELNEARESQQSQTDKILSQKGIWHEISN